MGDKKEGIVGARATPLQMTLSQLIHDLNGLHDSHQSHLSRANVTPA